MTPRQFLAQYEKEHSYSRYHNTYDRGLSPQVAKELHALLIKSKADSSKKALRYFRERSQWNKWGWQSVGIYPEDARKIYQILNVKMRHYLDDERNNPMKHNPKKTFTPSGKSKLRQAILKILQVGDQSLLENQKNVTKENIKAQEDTLAAYFTPSQLKSGAKFIRAIRDKTKIDGMDLFALDTAKQKHHALTYFAKELDTGKVQQESQRLRTPQHRYQVKADSALKKAHRSIKGKVMYDIPVLWLVLVQEGDEKTAKKEVLGGYSTASSARSAARAYMRGIKKAYDPLIPVVITGKTRKGNVSNRQAKLKVESRLTTRKTSKSRAGQAKFFFEDNAARKYLIDHMKKKPLRVFVEKITDKEKHRAYWKLFNSPAVGKMVWNPKG